MLAKELGLEPQSEGNNVYIPSKAVLGVLPKTSGYEKQEYKVHYGGDKKVLVIATEESHLETRHGKVFLTGNHPVEVWGVLRQLADAGFDYDIATPTGKPMKLEEWAMPADDPDFMAFFEQGKSRMDSPMTMDDALAKTKADGYLAVYCPGGHGSTLGIPRNETVSEILKYAMGNGMKVISICHGPSAFLSAADGIMDEDFLFKGYEIVCFPDGIDKQLPRFGYLPGKMPWYFGKRLEALGVDILNKVVTGRTHVDRNVITGDSPLAADKLGQLSAREILAYDTP